MPLALPTGSQPVLDAALAVGLGLMIGLEREHHQRVENDEVQASAAREIFLGVRTFALLALAGWVTGWLSLGGAAGAPALTWLPAALVLAVAGLLIVSLVRGNHDHGGFTTEAAALVTVLIGILVARDRAIAIECAVGTAVLLVSKPWFKRVVPQLRHVDFTATIQLVVALAVVLPLLPSEAQDAWGALSPRRIGLFVTLILSVSWVGYVLARTIGPRRSAGLTGVVGGLASSTAVTAAMAQRAAKSPEMTVPGQLATFLACAIMSVRLLVITAVISARVALAAAPSVLAIGAVMLLGAAWKWRALRRSGGAGATDDRAELELENPMSLVQAVKWGGFMTVVLLAAALGQQYLGSSGVLASAAVSGLADVDAITLAVTRSSADGKLAADVAVLAIVIAVLVNTAVKAIIAWWTGGRRYGRDVALVFAVAVVSGLAVALGRALA